MRGQHRHDVEGERRNVWLLYTEDSKIHACCKVLLKASSNVHEQTDGGFTALDLA